MFTYFKKRRENKQKATAIYQVVVAQARLPVFYEQYGVPDSVDGRFEMIALHCFIMMRRFQEAGDKALSQALFDVFFKTMDRSLREMGVGDFGVPKHMKRMMQGFNGRAINYESALVAGDKDKLKEALIKNVYGTVDKPKDSYVNALAGYVEQSAKMKTTKVEFSLLKEQEKHCA